MWSELQGKPPKAVVADNAFGAVADYDVLCPLCKAWGVPLVELAFDALGGNYRGVPCASVGGAMKSNCLHSASRFLRARAAAFSAASICA